MLEDESLSRLAREIETYHDWLPARAIEFCEAYAATGAAAQAARDVGVTPAYGYTYAKKPIVLKLVALLRQRNQLRDGIDPAFKRAKLAQMLDRALLPDDYDPNIALKVIDMFNKMDGHYVERVEVAISLEEEIRLARERVRALPDAAVVAEQ